MAGLLSSPDLPPLSVQTWAKASAADFVGTAAAELDGTALAASYGPPYNNGTSAVQQVGPVNWQKLAGVTQPINAAQTFVLSPLSKLAPTTPALATALGTYTSASSGAAADLGHGLRQGRCTSNKVPFNGGMPGRAGGWPGAGDDVLRAQGGARAGRWTPTCWRRRKFYGTDYTKPLLFIADGGYYANLATSHAPDRRPVGRHERDRQLPRPAVALAVPAVVPRRAVQQLASSVDIWAVYLTGVATILLLLVPFIPGLRDIPRLIPVHRLIWRGNWEPASRRRWAAPAVARPGERQQRRHDQGAVRAGAQRKAERDRPGR